MSVQELENEVMRLRGALLKIAHGMDRKRQGGPYLGSTREYREVASEALRTPSRRAAR